MLVLILELIYIAISCCWFTAALAMWVVSDVFAISVDNQMDKADVRKYASVLMLGAWCWPAILGMILIGRKRHELPMKRSGSTL